MTLKSPTIIAHRGNLEGPSPDENHVTHITSALASQHYDVEIDVWYIAGEFWLGHDKPTYEVDSSFFHNSHLWCHAKNPAALKKLMDLNVKHVFWHENDALALTSSGHFWVYPGKVTPEIAINSVYVMPDIFLDHTKDKGEQLYKLWKDSGARGICTDYPIDFFMAYQYDVRGWY